MSEPQFLEVGAGNRRRRIAYRLSEGGGEGPQLLWLPGFLSDMASTKAAAVAEWAEANALPLMRFDYSGHGRSSGALLEASIGDWLEEVTAVWGLMGERPRIVIGSSMGGWTALLLARQLAKAGRSSTARRSRADRAGFRHDRSLDVARVSAGDPRGDRD